VSQGEFLLREAASGREQASGKQGNFTGLYAGLVEVNGKGSCLRWRAGFKVPGNSRKVYADPR
jgi:hypothetical protein